MILIIGGAYQGKLDFAKETFGITDADIHICGEGEIDFSKKCIYKIEDFTYGHPDQIGYFKVHREEWRDSILILQDIFCGVVPMGAENRTWRQNTGRLSQYLSKEATQVSRIFLRIGAKTEMNIYLIRHGKTEANERHLYCGSTDLPLSKAGAIELCQLHYDIKNVRFLTSGMKRTNETLKILFKDVPFEVEPRFREVDFGIFEMHSYNELKDTPVYQEWLTGDNEANVPSYGESGAQMKERVWEAFSEIREDTCIITHGGVIAAIMAHLFPEENKTRYDWQPKPGQGYAIAENTYRRIP